ncbi:MAG: CehA/McbA family metallohydrolase domain-containing protein [Saccharofermentanales bacterium]
MFINPYENFSKINWQKGNFHVHAGTGPGTCGVNPIEDVVIAYKGAGYNVLCISNHDLFTDTAEYAKKHGIILINGFEYSLSSHMLCIGVDSIIKGSHQEIIDQVNDCGGFTVINHPNWKVSNFTADAEKYKFSYSTLMMNQAHVDNIDIPMHWPIDKIKNLKGFAGVEIFNGVITRLMGSCYATDIWDSLLSGNRMVWGFGNDDFHNWTDIAKVSTVVGLNEFSAQDALSALKNGRTYVSTGLKLDTFDFDGKKIVIEASAYNNDRGEMTYRFIGKNGKTLKGDGNTYTLKGDEMYIRVEAINSYGAMLWTQPVYEAAAF